MKTATVEEVEVENLQFRDPTGYGAPVVQQDPFGGSYITAQMTQKPRNEAHVLAKIKARAEANGEMYYYSWEVNNRKTGKKDLIEGGSIKLANDLARVYGNCLVDTRSIDCVDHWMIYARFTDLETGFSMTRPYRQRKSQKVGSGFKDSGDNDRALDMMMQIGTSKAIRNVVANSLSDLFVEAFNTAKGAIVKRIAQNPAGALEAIKVLFGELSIEPHRAEMLVGRKVEKWTVQDMAKLWSTLNSIKDGFINADDVFPSDKPDGDDTPPESNKGNPLDNFVNKAEAVKPAEAKQNTPAAESHAAPEQAKADKAPVSPPQPAQEKVQGAGGDDTPPASNLAEGKTFARRAQEVLADFNAPPAPSSNNGDSVATLPHTGFNLSTVAGAKDAGNSLHKNLASTPEHDRQSIFEAMEGDAIMEALSAKGLGALASKIRALMPK